MDQKSNPVDLTMSGAYDRYRAQTTPEPEANATDQDRRDDALDTLLAHAAFHTGAREMMALVRGVLAEAKTLGVDPLQHLNRRDAEWAKEFRQAQAYSMLSMFALQLGIPVLRVETIEEPAAAARPSEASFAAPANGTKQ